MNSAQTIIEPNATVAPASAQTIIEGSPALAGLPRPLTSRGQPADGAASLALTPGAMFREWQLSRPIQVTSAEADLWMLTHPRTQEPAVLKLFRYGIRPKAEIQAAVRRLKFSSVVTVLATGEVGGRHFEVQEFIACGSLAQLFPAGPAPQEGLRAVLAELAHSLADVHAADIIHRDLKPANVLVRTRDPLDIVLADFGISSLSDLSLHLSNANRTAAYAAPEAMTGVVARASDWWSIGVMLLELLTGKHPFAGLDERTVNFVLVTRGVEVPADLPPDWALLIRGLLTRDHAKRWGLAQVESWLAGKQDIPIHYGLEPGGEAAQRKEPYKFAGRDYRDPAELAIALVENWDDATRRLTRGSIGEWVKNVLRDADLGARLDDITADRKLDEDQKLAAALLAMNPTLPLVLRGTVITPEWLAVNAAVQHLPALRLSHPGSVADAKDTSGDDIDIMRRAIELVRAEQHASPMQFERRLGVTREKAEKILDELASRHLVGPRTNVTARDVLVGREEGLSVAVGVLESTLPKWVEELRGDNWLTKTAARHRAAWEFFRLRKLPVNRTLADQLLLSPHVDAVWPLVEERRRQHARAQHKGLHGLLTKTEALSWHEAVALVAAEPAAFQTHDQVMLEDSLAWLDRIKLRFDRAQAERLILARSWGAVLEEWRARRAKFVAAAPAALEAMLRKDDPEYLEAVALITAEATHFETAQQAWLNESARWQQRLERLRRELFHPRPAWLTLNLAALATELERRLARLRAERDQMEALLNRQEPTFHEVEPTAEGMAAAQSADTREGELLVAVMKLEEDLGKMFLAARMRSLLLFLGMGMLIVLTGFSFTLAR
ncbi:MAG: protein kinase [Verrucomicrobia bacterium]|nr:protein kinase [Verrucomicrobiota bacterium]